MKAPMAVGSTAGTKRRWMATVLGLVLFSMLVPLVFLLGLHNTFLSSPPSSGSFSILNWVGLVVVAVSTAGRVIILVDHSYVSEEERNSDGNGLRIYEQQQRVDATVTTPTPVEHRSRDVDDLLRRLGGPTLPKVFGRDPAEDAKNKTNDFTEVPDLPKQNSNAHNNVPPSEGKLVENMKSTMDGKNMCEIRFGSYCLWREEHRESMKDSTVKKMKDLLFVARAYYPSIAKLPALDKLSHELKQNIQEFERVLSETTTDKDLPSQIEVKLSKMEATIAKVKSHPVDCNNVDKKFRQLVDLTEDEANFHMKQSAFLYQLAVQTVPKSLHCLSLRLTVDYFRNPPPDTDVLLADKFLNPELQHYVIFSQNVLASSSVINSTVMNSKESSNQVFHVLTNRQNYFAMKKWFFLNKYKEAAVQVLDIEELILKGGQSNVSQLLQMFLPEEFRISFRTVDKLSRAMVRTEYLSLFSYSHYLIPEIFQTLRKIVILDDDIIVQKDLSELWSIDIGEKVNAAVFLCAVKLGELKHYLGENSFNNEGSCAWMSGLNLVDLAGWRKRGLTESFQSLLHKSLMAEDASLEAAILRATLLVFEGLVYDLNDQWVISGLGYNYGLDSDSIKKAAVLHFNGNMKPWLELGIPKYKGFWRNFVNSENSFLSACNVNQ
ncbi:OLC1v1033480C3 [Oldenlandia corymbosa var. corymbosa]|uniref:Hexosyltransferase n=1 Tax=Oldenlandia corymbosa var. corymbosa TaxID=529605 RepID=A0AAV1CNF0_OLDCO|nr:OLC1v1033480C3 [Oldenlandia corymbosa var. corymbosa]